MSTPRITELFRIEDCITDGAVAEAAERLRDHVDRLAWYMCHAAGLDEHDHFDWRLRTLHEYDVITEPEMAAMLAAHEVEPSSDLMPHLLAVRAVVERFDSRRATIQLAIGEGACDHE